jgi:hypothetical protein
MFCFHKIFRSDQIVLNQIMIIFRRSFLKYLIYPYIVSFLLNNYLFYLFFLFYHNRQANFDVLGNVYELIKQSVRYFHRYFLTRNTRKFAEKHEKRWAIRPLGGCADWVCIDSNTESNTICHRKSDSLSASTPTRPFNK